MSKIRLFKVTSYYPQVLKIIYQKDLDLAQASYNDQLSAIYAFQFSGSDSWKYYLERTGNFDVEEAISNCEFSQKKWAQEQSFKIDSRWKEEILLEQIIQFQPDVLFINDWDLSSEFRSSIKEKCKSIKLVMDWDGIAHNNLQKFEHSDLILSCVPDSVSFYKKNHKKAYYFLFGFDSRILSKINVNQPKIFPVSFIGSVALFSGGHYQRAKMLSKLIDKVPLDVFLSKPDDWQWYHPHQVFQVLQGNFRSAYFKHKLGSRSRGSKYGLDMFHTLAQSKIALNIHIDRSEGFAANMRLFEATGVRSCLLTDYKKNISDIFDPDREIVTFSSEDEAVDKIKWLLENNLEMLKIAKAGQVRTLESHSLDERINECGLHIQSIL